VSLPADRDTMTAEEFVAYRASCTASKYRAEPVIVDGMRFDSTGEAARWGDLQHLLASGAIANLRRQVPYDLHTPSGAVVGRLVLDFTYREEGAEIFEDYKGFQTALWKWKKRHFNLEYGPIRITGK